jgi:hypothetical protein
MEKNFTPLDLSKINGKKESSFNTILLAIATLTALILVVVLFVLIKKQIGT